MTDNKGMPAEEWYASLPTVYMAAGALITDTHGRILLVKPNYRPSWGVPGGVVEAGEAPHKGCAREVREELGLDLEPGRLLVIQWTPPLGDRPRSMLHFLFDGGSLSDDAEIRLQVEELDDYAFVTAGEAADLLDPNFAHRIPAALRARREGNTCYLPVGDRLRESV